MAPRGKKPKPTAIKERAGNPGRRPLNKKEPKYKPANLNVPRGRLPKDGQRAWKLLAKPLADKGVLTEADLIAFEMLCIHYALARQAADILDKIGLFMRDRDNEPRKNPATQIFRDNSQHLRAYLAEFGLTPSSRVRIQAINKVEEKTLAEILFEDVDGSD